MTPETLVVKDTTKTTICNYLRYIQILLYINRALYFTKEL